MSRSRRGLWVAGVAVVLVMAGAATMAFRGSMSGSLASDAPSVPTTRVVRGALELSVHGKGDLRASKFSALQAPPISGTLRLLTIVETGVAVKKDDVIMTFDPTEPQYQLEQAQSELLEAEQAILKFESDRDVQAAQDKFDLLQAGFDVRRARTRRATGPGFDLGARVPDTSAHTRRREAQARQAGGQRILAE